MDRSSGFGSTPCDWTPYSDSLSLRLPYPVKLATECKSLTHYAKGTQSPQLQWSSRAWRRIHFTFVLLSSRCARRQRTRRPLKLGLLLFVCMRFQDLFHSPSGVLFAFPSQYWFTIGRLRVFSLGGWSPHLQTGFHVSRPTYRALSSTRGFSCKGLSPSMAGLSRPFH